MPLPYTLTEARVRKRNRLFVFLSLSISFFAIAITHAEPDTRPAGTNERQSERKPETRPETRPDAKPDAKPDGKPPATGDKLSVTDHEVMIGGKSLKYRATAGTYQLKDEGGKPKADLFFVAYER